MDKQPTGQLSMPMPVRFICTLLLCLPPFSTFASPDFIMPPDHQSSYTVTAYDAPVGKMHNRLLTENNTIHYTSKAVATGLASLLVSENATETSILYWPTGKNTAFPEPQSYHFNYGKKHKKNQSITFSRDETGRYNIAGTYKNRAYSLSSERRVWDRHLIPLLMSSELQLNNKRASGNVYITDKGTLQTYTYILEKTENIKFKNESIEVLKFQIKKPGSKRMSYVWLSKTHYYLPLKVEQYKNDSLQGSMLLDNITFTQQSTEK